MFTKIQEMKNSPGDIYDLSSRQQEPNNIRLFFYKNKKHPHFWECFYFILNKCL